MAHAPTASASVSSLPSQNSATSSEAMSRQSSVSTSMTDTLDMMRVESSFSNYSVDHHPLAFDEDLAASFVSNVMETPGSSLVASFGFDEASCNKQFLSDVGYGFAGQPLSFIDTFNTANAVCRQDHSALRATFSQPQTQGMRRTVSKHATPSTSSADLKASQRRRKHIENAKQNTPTSLPRDKKFLYRQTSELPTTSALPSAHKTQTPNAKPPSPKLPTCGPNTPSNTALSATSTPTASAATTNSAATTTVPTPSGTKSGSASLRRRRRRNKAGGGTKSGSASLRRRQRRKKAGGRLCLDARLADDRLELRLSIRLYLLIARFKSPPRLDSTAAGRAVLLG